MATIKIDLLKKMVREIIKEEKMINEGIPMGESKLAQETATKLSFLINRMSRPDLEKEARLLASKIISLMDEDSKY